MKKSILTAIVTIVCALVLFSAAAAQAQPPRMSVDEQIKQLEKELKLTAEQSKAIKEILTEQQKERQTLREQSQGDREAMREKMKAIREKADNKILALLNDEQKALYTKMIKERASRRPGGGPGGEGHPPSGN